MHKWDGCLSMCTVSSTQTRYNSNRPILYLLEFNSKFYFRAFKSMFRRANSGYVYDLINID